MLHLQPCDHTRRGDSAEQIVLRSPFQLHRLQRQVDAEIEVPRAGHETSLSSMPRKTAQGTEEEIEESRVCVMYGIAWR